jgi:putative tricarboxylic transport membrane protein
MAEQSLRRALPISRGDWLETVTRPISDILVLATVAMLLLPLLRAHRQRARAAPEEID